MSSNQEKTRARDGWLEVTIPIREIAGRLGLWLLVVALVVYGMMAAVWGLPSWRGWPPSGIWLSDLAAGVAMLLVAYVVTVPIHEGLHALGMLATGTRWSDITFGARLLHGVVYVHCRTPMPLSAYRLVLLLPVVVTGFVPQVVAVAVGNGWIATYAYLMIVSAIGDLEMYWRLRPWSGDALVRDHPSLLGCELRPAVPDPSI